MTTIPSSMMGNLPIQEGNQPYQQSTTIARVLRRATNRLPTDKAHYVVPNIPTYIYHAF
jgi:hypothetical protein